MQKKLTWDDLNERQQQYMLLIYHTDQLQERNARGLMAMYKQSIPAEKWRWIEYSGMRGDGSHFYKRLYDAKLVDPGTGSTFEALRERGLILVGTRGIRLTTPGRAFVRKHLKQSE